MLTAIVHDVARTFRRAALPLGCYYMVTIAVPLANGVGESGGAFLDHTVVVAGVPLALVMLKGVLCGAVRALVDYKWFARSQVRYAAAGAAPFGAAGQAERPGACRPQTWPTCELANLL